MCKPATPGYEDRVKLILQSHVDMVCEKNAGTVHDFDNEPHPYHHDGEWLHADGTPSVLTTASAVLHSSPSSPRTTSNTGLSKPSSPSTKRPV